MSRKMKVYTITNSADGSAGKTSARSSVPINLDQLCNPVVTRLQELPTSDNYSQSNGLSSMSGQRIQGFAESRKSSRQFSPSGSHIQPKVRNATACLFSSTPFGRASVRPFSFGGEVMSNCRDIEAMA